MFIENKEPLTKQFTYKSKIKIEEVEINREGLAKSWVN